MDTLPLKILYYDIYPHLYQDSINLALTCKRFYLIYVELRDSNKLIAKRFERVNRKRSECLDNNKEGIVLDRMYELYPYHEDEIFLMFVKTWTFKYNNLNKYGIGIRHTKNKWKTYTDEIEFKSIDQFDYENSNLIETTWLITVNDYPDHDFWFALRLAYDYKDVEWDNNNGWNYDILHDHISCYNSIQKYPIMNFYGWPISNEFSGLNEWLHYWTAEKYG